METLLHIAPSAIRQAHFDSLILSVSIFGGHIAVQWIFYHAKMMIKHPMLFSCAFTIVWCSNFHLIIVFPYNLYEVGVFLFLSKAQQPVVIDMLLSKHNYNAFLMCGHNMFMSMSLLFPSMLF